MIITGLNNTSEITIEDKTYIRANSDETRNSDEIGNCNLCAFNDISIGCYFADCDGYIYIPKNKIDNE